MHEGTLRRGRPLLTFCNHVCVLIRQCSCSSKRPSDMTSINVDKESFSSMAHQPFAKYQQQVDCRNERPLIQRSPSHLFCSLTAEEFQGWSNIATCSPHRNLFPERCNQALYFSILQRCSSVVSTWQDSSDGVAPWCCPSRSLKLCSVWR